MQSQSISVWKISIVLSENIKRFSKLMKIKPFIISNLIKIHSINDNDIKKWKKNAFLNMLYSSSSSSVKSSSSIVVEVLNTALTIERKVFRALWRKRVSLNCISTIRYVDMKDMFCKKAFTYVIIFLLFPTFFLSCLSLGNMFYLRILLMIKIT